MSPTITFHKVGYDPFIDFLKAYSILCVVIAHIFPAEYYKYVLFHVWGGMQVPMFVIIQVFHAYKRNLSPKLKWENLFFRIICPFILIQTVIFSMRVLIWQDDAMELSRYCLKAGGLGPGSYYTWIFLQMAICLKLFYPIIKRFSFGQVFLFFLCISVGFEVIFSIGDVPEWINRLVCVRYLFLIPFGVLWIKEGLVLSPVNVCCSLISIFAVLFFVFTDMDLEPIFYNTGWETHRWICYYYLPVLLTYALFEMWKRIRQKETFVIAIHWLAMRSYEIFLSQMAIFACMPVSTLPFLPTPLVRFTVWAILAFLLSIVLGGILFCIRKQFLKC